VHSEQNHTMDVLLTRIFSILFWFNPVIWLYQKAILQNLEFIADSEALLKISDKKAYQMTLLKITAKIMLPYPIIFINH
jgi:beta-lactamase regulating signal transducer with metallopeptidase domain